MDQGRTAVHSEEIRGYRILERLGASGLSAVYRAAKAGSDTTVALRVLQPRFAEDRGAVAAFCRHANSSASLDHPNTVKVLAMHLDSPPYCFAMQHMAGGALADRLTPGGLSIGEAVAMWVQLCGAVDHAHDRGIMHGDITPRAILYDEEGNPALTGFGIAEEMAQAVALGITADLQGARYMSPEQLHGDAGDERSDVYSLAAVLHEALTGSPPAQRGRSPLNAGRRVDAVIRRALAANRWRRYASAGEFATALFEAAAEPLPYTNPRRRFRWLMSAAVVAISVIGVVGVYYSGGNTRAAGRVTSHKTRYSPLGPEVHATDESASAGAPSVPDSTLDESPSIAQAGPARQPEQRRAVARRKSTRNVTRRSDRVRNPRHEPSAARKLRVRSRPAPPAKAKQKAPQGPESAGPVI